MWWTKPLWLLLFVLIVPLLHSAGFTWNYGRSRNKSKPKYLSKSRGETVLKRLALLRVAAIGAVILALAGTSVILPTQNQQVVILADVSDSMGRAQIEVARNHALQLIKGLKSQDRVALVAFAGKPRTVFTFIAPEEAFDTLETAVLDASQPELSDLQAAIRVGRELLMKCHGNRSLVLFSDGRSNAGSSVSLALLSLKDIKVDVMPLGAYGSGLVAQGLELPEISHPGERVSAQWNLVTDQPRSIVAAIKVDGKTIRKDHYRIASGVNSIPVSLEAPETGFHRIELETTGEDGQPIVQANYGGMLNVTGPAQILVIKNETSPFALSGALRIQGMNVRETGVLGMPESTAGLTGYAAVVLDNIAATDIAESQEKALQNYVAGGGGLLVIGGDSSLGRGEYYATGLENLLPVQTDTRQRLFFNRAKILFVIDHSGSMAELVGNTSKQLAAMQGVAAAIGELNPQDQVGILSFDSSPDWALHFTPVSQKNKILESLSQVGDGGGTDMSTAFEEVLKEFGPVGPNRRHVVILTDGMTNGTVSGFEKLSRKLKANNVTITTIGVGQEVNVSLLKNIAKWGEGNFYRASLDQIPKVIKKETIRVTRDLIQEGRFKPVIRTKAPVLKGLETTLPINGYLMTKPKNLATVYLEVGKKDPLLTDWRYGNGRVAVFTSDSGARWLAPWSGSSTYNLLWAQIIRSIERSTSDTGLKIQTKLEASTARIVVEAVDAGRRLRTGMQLIGRFVENNEAFGLRETAPGHYETSVMLTGTGLQHFEVRDRLSGNWSTGWIWNPPGEELQVLGPDFAMLGHIAAATGGMLLGEKDSGLPVPGWAWAPTDLTYGLIILALLLFLIELGYRSTSLGQVTMARAMAEAWWMMQIRFIGMVKRGNRDDSPKVNSNSEDMFNVYLYLAKRARKHQDEGATASGEEKE